MINKRAKSRAIEISYKHQLSHLGSVITSIDIIDEIYSNRDPIDKFVLDSGHAYLAQCVINEKYGRGDAEKLFLHHGTHPDRCVECQNQVSSGSLGLAGAIAVGMAVKSQGKVNVLTSDGALAEGIWWESLNFVKSHQVSNFRLYVNANGFGAYREINPAYLQYQLGIFEPYIHFYNTRSMLSNYAPVLSGMDAHYKIISKEDMSYLFRRLI